MRHLDIEWLHYEKDGSTCIRCSATGKTLAEVAEDLRRELAQQGITVSFTEKKLGEEEIPRSNMILFNGVPLEELLSGAEVSVSACDSCSCLTGTDTLCRTVEYEGETFEEIPEDLIRKAASAALRMDRQ